MAMSITLKNAALADVVYTESAHRGNAVDFISRGDTLLNSSKITLEIRKNSGTNRCLAKLSIPTTGVSPSTGLQGVKWTEVGSIDLSAVLAADAAAANDFIAQFASLAGSDAVKLMYTVGAIS